MSLPELPEHHQRLCDLLTGGEPDQARELARALELTFDEWHALVLSVTDQEDRPLDFLRAFGADETIADQEARRVSLACAERLLPLFPAQATLLEETLAVVRAHLDGRASLEELRAQEQHIDELARSVLDEHPHEFAAYAAAEAANSGGGASGLRGACQEIRQHAKWAEQEYVELAWLSAQLRTAAQRLWGLPEPRDRWDQRRV